MWKWVWEPPSKWKGGRTTVLGGERSDTLSAYMLKATEAKMAVLATDKEAQYDEMAKRLLSEKIVLAHILANVVKEFEGMKPEEIVPLIEGEPYIGIVPMEPGLFYCSRLISSQKGRDFEHTNYDDINPVHSIWIVMNCEKNCLTHIHLAQEDLLGDSEWGGATDALNLYMIGIGKELPEKGEKQELHRLLGTFFSETMSKEEKLDIIGNEYGIPLEHVLGKQFGK